MSQNLKDPMECILKHILVERFRAAVPNLSGWAARQGGWDELGEEGNGSVRGAGVGMPSFICVSDAVNVSVRHLCGPVLNGMLPSGRPWPRGWGPLV